MKHYQEYIDSDEKFTVGNQPRKSVLRRAKKEHMFKRFENEVDMFDKHRHSYKRAVDKNFMRAQLREDQLMF